MAAATVAVLAGAAVAAGASAYPAKKQGDAADKAESQAVRQRRSAKAALDQVEAAHLDLSQIDPAQVPEFLAPLIKIFSEEGPDAIYQVFRQDIGEAGSMLDELVKFSTARDTANAQATRGALEAFTPGSVAGLDAGAAAENDFLNFRLPAGARNELQRQAAETAVRGGFAGSGVQAELARARTFEYQIQNFFQANQASQQRAQGIGGLLGNFGLAQDRLPAPGLGAELALQNSQRGLQQSLTNYQNTLDVFRENQRRLLSEEVDRVEHQRNVGLMRANLATGQANAFQQSANQYAQQSAQGYAQAGQILGSAAGTAFGGGFGSILGAQSAQKGFYTASGQAPYAAGVGSLGYPTPRIV